MAGLVGLPARFSPRIKISDSLSLVIPQSVAYLSTS